VYIEHTPQVVLFKPHPPRNGDPVTIEHAELEALRLVDLIGLSQEEAGERMGVSRGTIWRFLKRVREKVARALTEGRRIRIVTTS
jgi:predicted DNA-binding protein (UPF0251 family)